MSQWIDRKKNYGVHPASSGWRVESIFVSGLVVLAILCPLCICARQLDDSTFRGAAPWMLASVFGAFLNGVVFYFGAARVDERHGSFFGSRKFDGRAQVSLHPGCGSNDGTDLANEFTADSEDADFGVGLDIQDQTGGGDSEAIAEAVEGERLMEITFTISQRAADDATLRSAQAELKDNALPAEMLILGGVHQAAAQDPALSDWDLLRKNILDRFGAVCLLIALAPLFLAVALAITCDSPGPIIFRQRRSGWFGRDFIIFKFRTMYAEPETQAYLYQTKRNDRRCTRVGTILRRTSLDELPQLLNVLLGDMSLVGPRPLVDCLHVRDRSGQEIIAQYARRNRVKPGMTGWAQVNGLRGPTASSDDFRRRVDYDLFYIENWSLLFDLQILARTPVAMLLGDNAF